MRQAPALHHSARPRPHTTIRVQAAAWRKGRGPLKQRHGRTPAARARRRCAFDSSPQSGLPLSRAGGAALVQRARLSRRRRRASDAAFRRPGHEQRRSRRPQSRVEISRSAAPTSRPRLAGHLRERAQGSYLADDQARFAHGQSDVAANLAFRIHHADRVSRAHHLAAGPRLRGANEI